MNTTGKVLAGLALVGAGGLAGSALTPSGSSTPTSTKNEPEASVKIDTSAFNSGSNSDSQSGRSAPIGDRDCTDFATHDEAQSFFLKAGAGDPHKLDRDGDGIACETLP